MVIAVQSDSSTPPNGVADSLYLDQLRARVTKITPERAASLLETLAFERQRNIMAAHVEYLLAMMQVGELTDLLIQEVEFPNGRKVLVDGYHRLTALVQYGRPLLAVIVTHRVNDEHDLAMRYAKIDRPSTRKPRDMLRAFGVDQESELTAKMLSTVNAGVAILMSDFSKHGAVVGQKSLIQRTDATRGWLPEGRAYASCLAGSSNEVSMMLSRAPVTAIALATLRYQPGPAETFWSRIAAEDGLPKDSPEARLLAYLRTNRVARVGQGLYCRYVATAWNAYYTNRTLKLLKVYDPSAPVSLAGTPVGRV